MKLQGKVVLITGAARRVGRQIALELAHAGCHVAVHYNTSAGDAAELVSMIQELGGRAIAIPGNLQNPACWPGVVQRTVETLGAVDILVNNASIFITEALDTLDGFSLDDWDRMQRINLTAPAALVHYARPHLEAGDGGRIVNLCDAGVERPQPSHLSYACAKAGLVALTRALAIELAPKITVNGVAPGIAMFPDSYDESLRASMVKSVPLRRAGDAADIARAVRFLVETGDYVTGQIIPVDGGRSLV